MMANDQGAIMTEAQRASLSIALDLPNGGQIDAEDIALIETIRTVRSILGASRQMALSYRKTWLMVDALNRMFEEKIIETFPGRRGAGAEVTMFGERVVSLYRSSERRARSAAAAALDELAASLNWAYDQTPAATGTDGSSSFSEVPQGGNPA